MGMDYERGGTQKDHYEPGELVEVPCPYCGSGTPSRLHTEYGNVGVVRCTCGLIYTSPRVRDPEKNYWGDRDAYYREARLIFQGTGRHHRDPNYLEELDLIARYRPRGRFLDVGCGMGMLLRHVSARGWEAVGVEPSPTLSALARDELGLTILNRYLEEVPTEYDATFDVVALSDVFEHVSEPLAMLGHVRRLLKPDGVLYVKVPNARFNLLKQLVVRLRGRNLQHGVWDAYEHVIHYTDESLRRMLAKGGFRVETLSLARPVQIPVWHHHVGQYFQYPSPVALDWKRHLGRAAFHLAGKVERVLRLGTAGYLPSSLAVIARPAS